MLIGIDASRANNLNKTGTEWYSYHLIQYLKQLANPDRFVLYSREKLRNGLENLPDNFKSKVLGWPPKRFWTQLRLSLEMLVHRPDVLFVPAHTMPLSHPRKTIITLHDIGFTKYPELYSRSELKYHNWAAKYALKKAKVIITVSEFTKNEIIDFYQVKPERIKVVYLAYDSHAFKFGLDRDKIREIKQKYGLNAPYFFYIGRLEKKKNILGLLSAFNKITHSEANLVLAGQPGLGYDQIKKIIRENSLADKVKILGWVPQADVPYLMAGAIALVMPSFYEGFCLPILEAMAVGTPVIGANNTAIPEIAGGAALLVNPKDTDKLATKMDELINNEELRQELKAVGLKRVQAFSWQKCAQETLKIIASV